MAGNKRAWEGQGDLRVLAGRHLVLVAGGLGVEGLVLEDLNTLARLLARLLSARLRDHIELRKIICGGEAAIIAERYRVRHEQCAKEQGPENG